MRDIEAWNHGKLKMRKINMVGKNKKVVNDVIIYVVSNERMIWF